MRTSKPISTISYNSLEFLVMKLEELVDNHKISDYMFIKHFAEEDESKDHTHLWIMPNTLLDTMDLQNHFKELDLIHPNKPLGCIDFRSSDCDEWILYSQHFEPYLRSKNEDRQYHYTRDDFVYHDEYTFEDRYNHAFKGSKWAERYQMLEQLKRNQLNPVDLIFNGTVPLQLASQLNAIDQLKQNHGPSHTVRGVHKNHENNEFARTTSKKPANLSETDSKWMEVPDESEMPDFD